MQLQEWLKTIAILVVSALLSLVLWDLHSFIRDGRTTAATTMRDLHVTVIEAGLTLKNLREASLEWKKASQTQSQQTTQAMSGVSAAASKLTSFVARTDESINSQIIPRLSTVLEQQSLALLQTQLDLQANLKEILVTTQQLQKTLADADAQLASPAIQKTLDNLSVASENMSEATGHLANITADGEKTADYYAKRLMTPQSFIKTVALTVLRLGSEARLLLNK
jgi:hypothetical protein